MINKQKYNTSRRAHHYPITNKGQIIQTKINLKKAPADISNTIEQMDLTNVYKSFYSVATQFFSNTHTTFFRINYILGHKTSFSKLKTEVIRLTSLDQNGIVDHGKPKI